MKVGGQDITNIRYADDTVLLAKSVEDLQKLLDVVVRESELKGLSINCKKTECMVVSKKKDIPRCSETDARNRSRERLSLPNQHSQR